MSVEIGPSSPEPVPQFSAARRRVLARLALEQGPVTLTQLADALGGHPNTTRRHLDALLRDGYVAMRAQPGSGPGRPPHAFSVTPAGRRLLEGDPAVEGYRALVYAMAAHLRAGDNSEETAREIGRQWGKELAGGGRLQGLDPFTVWSELGFDPEELPEGAGWRLRICPVREAAQAYPDVVCPIHHGLIEAVLAATESGDPEVESIAEPGACLVIRRTAGQVSGSR